MRAAPYKPSLEFGIELIQKPRGVYRVVVAGVEVAQVTREPGMCWSYAPWHIVGDRTISRGGVWGKSKRVRGFCTKESAAREAAIINSGKVVAALCAADPL